MHIIKGNCLWRKTDYYLHPQGKQVLILNYNFYTWGWKYHFLSHSGVVVLFSTNKIWKTKWTNINEIFWGTTMNSSIYVLWHYRQLFPHPGRCPRVLLRSRTSLNFSENVFQRLLIACALWWFSKKFIFKCLWITAFFFLSSWWY